jgi:hypothetical protein
MRAVPPSFRDWTNFILLTAIKIAMVIGAFEIAFDHPQHVPDHLLGLMGLG